MGGREAEIGDPASTTRCSFADCSWLGGLAHPQMLKTVIRAATCQPEPRLFRGREIFDGLKVEGLSAEQGGRLVKRQCAIEVVWGIEYGAEEMGIVSSCEVVCHAQVLSQ